MNARATLLAIAAGAIVAVVFLAAAWLVWDEWIAAPAHGVMG